MFVVSDKFIKSPLNYTGGKYKILSQLIPLFPSKYKRFIDIFCGGLNVAVNIRDKPIIANDNCKELINLYLYFQKTNLSEIENSINKLINKYGLSKSSENGYESYNTNSVIGLASYNRNGYLKLREDYNNDEVKSPIKFFTLIIFAFNNQIRFNSKREFNLPVNKRDFNNNIKANLSKFVETIKKLNIIFANKSYIEVDLDKNDFIYLDPPYLIGNAAYNESNGWNIEKEKELYSFLDNINNKKIKFALSNVFENKGNKNEILIEWSKKYKVHKISNSFRNSNYQAKNKLVNTTEEVLVTNY